MSAASDMEQCEADASMLHIDGGVMRRYGPRFFSKIVTAGGKTTCLAFVSVAEMSGGAPCRIEAPVLRAA